MAETATTTTKNSTIIITAERSTFLTRRPCHLCGGTTEKEETLYTFPDPLDGSESFACHSCAHAGSVRLRALAVELADGMEARAAKLLADAPMVRSIMGTADYATMELPGWKAAAYDRLAEGMRTWDMSWEEEDRARAYLGLPPAYENRQAELELGDALARYDAANRPQLQAVPGTTT